jgi:hypothetical protein
MSYTITIKKTDGEVIEIAVPSTSTTTTNTSNTSNTASNVVDKPWKNAKIVTESYKSSAFAFTLLDFDGDGKVTQSDIDTLKKLNLNTDQILELYRDFPSILVQYDAVAYFQSMIEQAETCIVKDLLK